MRVWTGLNCFSGGSSEHSYDTSDFIIGKGFLGMLSNYHLIKVICFSQS